MGKNQKKTGKFKVNTIKTPNEEPHIDFSYTEPIAENAYSKAQTLEEYLGNSAEKAKSDLLIELKQLEDNYQIYLPEDEREILFGYVKDKTGQELITGFRYCMGFIRATKFGFYPKELKNLLEKDNEDIALSISFVLGVIEFTWARYDDSLEYLNRVVYNALNNKLNLPRKVFLTAMQLVILCHRMKNQYDKVNEMTEIFLKNVRSIEAFKKICEEKFIIELDWDSKIEDDFVILPDIEFREDEIEKTETSIKSSISLNTMVDLLKANERNVMEHLDSATEQIIHQVHLETPASVRLKLINEYGPWIKELSNESALATAEFLYDALGNASWAEVIVGYWNVVESEIRNRLIVHLRNHLFQTQNNYSLSMMRSYSITITRDIKVEEIQNILDESGKNPILLGFLSHFAPNSRDYISRDLPSKFKRLRDLRNPAAHGAVISERYAATETKNLVLGTPEHPGILKKLAELPKVP